VRTDPSAFATRNTSAFKSPRFVIEIEFTPYSVYLSSHEGIEDVPSVHIEACIIEPSISSQKLNPDQGRAEIGAASFTVADLSGDFTARVRTLLAGGDGLRGKQCRFYLGYEGMPFADFVMVGTQVVKEAAFERGAYRISCNDIQRQARKDIFNLQTTTLSATVEVDTTTISVNSTAGFTTVLHGNSYTDAASQTVGYIKIKDEIVRYTGTTATTFTGCTRGVLGTTAGRYVVDGATAQARREKVTEYVYLEMPGPKLLYAILTGTIYGTGASLPTTWHVGIDPALIRTQDFTGIGNDLWNVSDDSAGIILRFEGLTKQDGKAFCELEILRLLGLFMPVYADGLLGLRRMTRVLGDATGIVTLDESNSVMVGDLKHDMESLHNNFSVTWNWNGKEFTRTTTYLDAASAAVHGRATEMEIKAKGLYGGLHTDGLIFKLLDSIRDRYSAPPVRLSIEVMHSLNRIEVGDVVRVRHTNLRDYAGQNNSIDRAFEVQSVTVNHRTGAVELDLFGSTSQASVIPPTTPTNSATDAFYVSEGTNLASVMTIAGGVVSGGPYTLSGLTDLTAAGSIWYYDGDLTIPEGVTISISGNVQLRVKGYLTINGTISGIGGGLSGVADTSSTDEIAGTPGYVGNSRGFDGCAITAASSRQIVYYTSPPLMTASVHGTFPYIAVDVVGDTVIGLPTDLRGTGGGPGGKVTRYASLEALVFGWPFGDLQLLSVGGAGGAGGAGLCTISRGLGLGANGRINLSGADTAAAAAYSVNVDGKVVEWFPGTGGAGGPGSYLCLIDGSLLSVPDLSGRFVARTGRLAIPAYKTALSDKGPGKYTRADTPFAGYLSDPSAISGLDLSYSCQRIQFLPAEETPDPDSYTLPAVSGITITQGSSGFVVTFTPAAQMPVGTMYEIWTHTAASPFSAATKRMEGSATAFFVPQNSTNTVYLWVRASYRQSNGITVYSAVTPATDGVPAKPATMAGTYATATPTSISAATSSSVIMTGGITAGLVGATASTYAWARVSGSTAIVANSPSAATTTFTASDVATDATVSAVFRCTINSSFTVDVAVDCTNIRSILAVTVSPQSVNFAGTTPTITGGSCTATPSGGTGTYYYSWYTAVQPTRGSIEPTPGDAATTSFEARYMEDQEIRSATVRVRVSDTPARTPFVEADVQVTVTRAAMSVSLSPTSLYQSGTKSAISTGFCRASAINGVAPYTYVWDDVPGTASGPTMEVVNSTSFETQFRCAYILSGQTSILTWRCTATDSVGAVGTADITVTIQRV